MLSLRRRGGDMVIDMMIALSICDKLTLTHHLFSSMLSVIAKPTNMFSRA